MANKEHYSMGGVGICRKMLAAHPDYKVFWQSGYSFRGAKEYEVSKETTEECCRPYLDASGQWHYKRPMTFEEKMEQNFSWACAIDLDVDHDAKEIHMNGFGVLDME